MNTKISRNFKTPPISKKKKVLLDNLPNFGAVYESEAQISKRFPPLKLEEKGIICFLGGGGGGGGGEGAGVT